MRASRLYWKDLDGWTDDPEQPQPADLVLYFGSRQMLADEAHYTAMRRRFPDANILGCSTGGQMAGGDVSDRILTALALDFANTPLRLAQAVVADPADSRAAGAEIGCELAAPDLAGIFVLSDGLHINGSALVEGIVGAVGRSVPVSGGLAGDGDSFAETLVGCNGQPASRVVAAVGFYGTAIQLGHGSAGGWDVFGPKRRITRAKGNVLLEVDRKPALDLYKLYLGPEESQKLPGSALLFPMRISDPRHPEQSVVRTVLSVDADTGSMTFAGDMPEGWTAQLMRGSFSRLCAGAAAATHDATRHLPAGATDGDSAAILVSCIGRRLLMGQRIDEEIEAATAELPSRCQPIGFYSYGEIAPHDGSGEAKLHNQTMTVTLLRERAAEVQKLLAKQLEKARLPDGGVDLEKLTALVATAYEEAEHDRERTDRSITLMVEEIEAFQKGLEDKIARRTAQLRDSRKALKLQNNRMAAALDSTGYAISIFDGDKKLIYCNSYFLDLYHLPRRIGRPGTPFETVVRARIEANSYVGDDPGAYYRERVEGVDRGQLFVDVHRLNTGEMVSINHVPLSDGGWVATHKDITEFTRLQEELAHRAYHDALTGLPNRHMLQQRLGECVRQADGLGSFALLLIDLDGFKSINDTLGHSAGDSVLREVARRLEAAAGNTGMAARMGGDEFAIVMDVGSVARDAHMMAVAVTNAGREPFRIDGQQADVGLSVGVAVAPGDGATTDALLKNADLALYAAKAEKRGSYRFFEPAMDKALRDRRRLERDLSQALERGEFEVYYQPILNLKRQAFSGFEALLRWRHAEDGMISPARFIPVAEETGLIVPIGEWVLREAIAEAAKWPRELRVAINVSSVQFQRGNVVATIMNALGRAGMAPERVEIEITESVFFENSVANLDALRQLHALGLKIALDDFGTGFSALSYLLKYPFDKIKIDGAFVRAIDTAAGAQTIVRAIAEIGHGMGIVTTAEGVETAAQLRNIHAAGYTEAQGFLIARPMPADQVKKLLDGEDDSMPFAPMAQRAAS